MLLRLRRRAKITGVGVTFLANTDSFACEASGLSEIHGCARLPVSRHAAASARAGAARRRAVILLNDPKWFAWPMTRRRGRPTVKIAMYPHLELEENRRELERERRLRRQIHKAHVEAREQRRSSRTPLLSRVLRVFRPSLEPCPEPCPEPL